MRKESSRAVALAVLAEWRCGKKFADAILNKHLRAADLPTVDRAFATELTYGVLRNLTLLDFWIGELRSSGLDHSSRDLLRLGLYQLFLLETAPHAAIYETVELADRRNRPLVNGVLRSASRRQADLLQKANRQDLNVRQSHPQFLIDRWRKNFGEKETEALCEWNNRPAPIYARINQIKNSETDFLSKYSNTEPVAARGNFVRLTSIPESALASGDCYIQDPSTALACRLLDPQPGNHVLDACAAPGGKTGYLAELMKNEGSILACDRDKSRVETLRDNLDRLGVKIAQTLRHDWTQQLESGEAVFDRILIDAPCSNTGVMRRRIDVRWRLTRDDFPRMAAEQLRIVRATIRVLKPGGILVDSTCSLEPEENEQLVSQIVSEFSFLRLDEQQSVLPFRNGFDGAFAAKLVRL